MSAPADAQRWDPVAYERNARFVAELGGPVVELLGPRPGERILDLGCGDGWLTERLAALGCEVVGVDGSAEQVAAARARGVDARVARAEALPFESEFDAVFSNAVLHWVKDAAGAIAAVRRALRPGGRFVAEMGGAGCVAKIRAAIGATLAARGADADRADPWFFPTPEVYGALLERGGFTVRSIALVPRPTPLPGDVAGWIDTFAQPFLAVLDPAERAGAVAEIRERLVPDLFDPEKGWTADYVRLRFAADRREG
ncbi:MAG TPA: class I SAM-dependent methyltransferase [Myxococcota bacterium]|nr:class I SAM-dependent methyltransferase [Myxococcota bacterium]